MPNVIRFVVACFAFVAVVVLAGAWLVSPPSHRDIVGTEKKLYSQFDEELIIRDFFQDPRDGVFLDVGCAYPIRASTTYYLEKHLGWTGIGVDALSEYGPDWRRQRPNSQFVAFLVSDHSDTLQKFYRAPLTGVSSASKELAGGQRFNPNLPPQPNTEIEVPTITLTHLLDRLGVSEIDFLSMDIEGHEPKALAGFDIERFRPELVCIEKGLNQELLLDYFSRHGYERLDRYLGRDNANWYFAPRLSRRELLRSSLSDLRCRLASCDASPDSVSGGGAG